MGGEDSQCRSASALTRSSVLRQRFRGSKGNRYPTPALLPWRWGQFSVFLGIFFLLERESLATAQPDPRREISEGFDGGDTGYPDFTVWDTQID